MIFFFPKNLSSTYHQKIIEANIVGQKWFMPYYSSQLDNIIASMCTWFCTCAAVNILQCFFQKSTHWFCFDWEKTKNMNDVDKVKYKRWEKTNFVSRLNPKRCTAEGGSSGNDGVGGGEERVQGSRTRVDYVVVDPKRTKALRNTREAWHDGRMSTEKDKF